MKPNKRDTFSLHRLCLVAMTTDPLLVEALAAVSADEQRHLEVMSEHVTLDFRQVLEGATAAPTPVTAQA